MKKIKANIVVSPITIIIGGLITLVFALTKLSWVYYLIGIVAGLLYHGIFLKMSLGLQKKIEADPEGKIFDIKKSSIVYSLIRMVLVAVIFLGVIAKADVKKNPNAMWDILFAVGGFLTYKIIMILCLIFIKEGDES